MFTPCPRLILEYVPLGSLEDQTNMSDEECVTILCQGLSALVDLHGREEPIVHRDIKPGNILVHSRDPLHIKLSDFGLSRVSNDLTTFCGTALYLAPEVYTKQSYTPVVDVWSLGVVVFELAYRLPNHHGYERRRWCRRIIEEVNDWDSEDLIDFLSTAMLVMEPKLRHSAEDCYKEASRLPILSQGRCPTLTPTSYAEVYKKTMCYNPAEGQEVGDRSPPISSILVSTAEYFYLEEVVEEKLNGVFVVTIPDGRLVDPN
jgi:serine/threonine protein kinase